MGEIERRVLRARALRVVGDGGEPRVEGYAAVFGQQSEDLGGFRERIEPGAFLRTIREDDVRALWNHDRNFVLGRNTAGTLRLREDRRGLFFIVTPPDVQWARDALVTIRRGDVDGMSFGFEAVRDRWGQDAQGRVERTLLEVKLYDVSPATFPAYSQTSAQVRALVKRLGKCTEPWKIDLIRRRRELDRLEERV